jgi:Domain of unknown function (DUF4120)
MLTILNQAHFDKVKAFAEQVGLADQLQRRLDWLSHYGAFEEYECRMGRDFAPHSFSFAMFKDGKYSFRGGLIYQGPDSPADGSFPSLTVSLASGTGWFVHT